MAYNAESYVSGNSSLATGVPYEYLRNNALPLMSGATNPFSEKFGQQGYNPLQNYPNQQDSMMPYDQFAGAEYTGPENYAPPLSNPDDYWNQRTSGYDQMPMYESESMPFDVDVMGEYQQGDLNLENSQWENAYNYAPWSGYGPGGHAATAGELTQQPGFSAEGGHNAVGYDWGREAAIPFFPGSGAFGMKKKKRPHYEFEAPSYQGHMFTPEEGFPDYYQPSQESYNKTQQDIYTQNQGSGMPYGSSVPGLTNDSYDYNYGGGQNQTGQQDYVGQQNQAYGSLYSDQGQNSLYQTFKPGEYGA